MESREKWLREAKAETSRFYWWGIPTFFRCPWNEDPTGCDIALVGVPHSSGNGSTERDQHLGPRAVRHVSGWYRRAHLKFGFVPWDECRILDLGDVPLPEAMVNDVCVKHIETYYKGLDIAGVRPVSMGGDHGITGPIIKAIAGPQANISGGRKAALLHFDAHTDSYDQLGHWLGSRRSAAHWASYTVAEGHIDPSKSVQIGIRGNAYTLDWRESSHRIGYRVISMDEFEELGIETTIETIRQRVGDSPLYITLDLDALDPSAAPAVSNMEPGYVGFMPSQVIKIMHGLRGLDIIGADIVCLIPTKDNPNNITSMTAMVLMFEQIALIADYIRTAGSSKTS